MKIQRNMWKYKESHEAYILVHVNLMFLLICSFWLWRVKRSNYSSGHNGWANFSTVVVTYSCLDVKCSVSILRDSERLEQHIIFRCAVEFVIRCKWLLDVIKYLLSPLIHSFSTNFSLFGNNSVFLVPHKRN